MMSTNAPSPLSSNEEEGGGVVVGAAVEGGTRQDVVDAGCRQAHDPQLYQHDRLAEPCACTLEQISINDPGGVQQQQLLLDDYHRKGYLVFDKAFASVVHDLDTALTNLTTGVNQRFKQDVEKQVNDSQQQPPTFSAGESTAWVQYEAGTKVRRHDDDNDSSSLLLTPSIADKVRKLMGFVGGYEQAIDAVVQSTPLQQLVTKILDCDDQDAIELFQSQALLKPPQGGREKPWHQDNAYFDIASANTRVVGCWIAIDEATLENGCMRMLEGGHLDGPRHHVPLRDYQIADNEILQRRRQSTQQQQQHTTMVAIPLAPGGLVLFDGMIPHGTPTNTTMSTRRRALQFHWIAKGTPRVPEHAPGGRAEIFGRRPATQV